MMCGNTPEERLELLEPQCKDWHCMLCVLTVRLNLSVLELNRYSVICVYTHDMPL